jgi:hypothetical protein
MCRKRHSIVSLVMIGEWQLPGGANLFMPPASLRQAIWQDELLQRANYADGQHQVQVSSPSRFAVGTMTLFLIDCCQEMSGLF